VLDWPVRVRRRKYDIMRTNKKSFTSFLCRRCFVGKVFILLVLFALPQVTHSSPDLWRKFGWENTDFSKHSISFDEIFMGIQLPSGLSSKDRIPAIDEPAFIPLVEVNNISATSPVVSVVFGEDARAYPLAILTWHEIVNDTVGGVPIVVTYCPLCNAALVFRRTLNGQVLDFGTSGMLRNSDLVMYDRQSDTWWQQFTGEAIVGEMTGQVLSGVPARLESFERFAAQYPNGKVLVPNDPEHRRYGDNPYVGYDSAAVPFLYRGVILSNIEPMARVIMVATNAGMEGVSLDHLKKVGDVKLGEVLISWMPGQNSALDAALINEGRDVGNVIAQRVSKNGLVDVVYHVTFAFAFHAFHPDGKILNDS
jgi:hypothetical protein